eukprot:12275818-Prorocentrum_lima.AAC.1
MTSNTWSVGAGESLQADQDCPYTTHAARARPPTVPLLSLHHTTLLVPTQATAACAGKDAPSPDIRGRTTRERETQRTEP